MIKFLSDLNLPIAAWSRATRSSAGRMAQPETTRIRGINRIRHMVIATTIVHVSGNRGSANCSTGTDLVSLPTDRSDCCGQISRFSRAWSTPFVRIEFRFGTCGTQHVRRASEQSVHMAPHLNQRLHHPELFCKRHPVTSADCPASRHRLV